MILRRGPSDRKKNVSFEVRISDEDKAEFVETCQQQGLSASEVTRKLMQSYTARRNGVFRAAAKGVQFMSRKPLTILGLISALGLSSLAAATLPVSAVANDYGVTMTIAVRDSQGDVVWSDENVIQFTESSDFSLSVPENVLANGFRATGTASLCVDSTEELSCAEGESIVFSLRTSTSDGNGTFTMHNSTIVGRIDQISFASFNMGDQTVSVTFRPEEM